MCDLGGLCNVTVAVISVRTNQFAPVLNQSQFHRLISENWILGESVFDVDAHDRDLAVSLFFVLNLNYLFLNVSAVVYYYSGLLLQYRHPLM